MKKLSLLLAALSLAATGTTARAADGSWLSNADGNWSTAANWLGNAIATGTHFTARFTNAVTATRIVTLDAAAANVTIGNLLFASPGNSNWVITAGGFNLAVTSGIPTITVNGNSTLIQTKLGGAQGLAKAGGGTLVLTATNTWTGGTLISAGTLQIGNFGTGGDAGTLPAGVVTNNGTLAIARTNDVTIANNIVGAGTLNINGLGAGSGTGFTNLGPNTIVTLAGTNSFGGNVNVISGTVRIVHSQAFGTSNKTVALSTGTAGNPILLLDGSGGPIDLPGSITFQLSNARGTITNVAGDNILRGPLRLTAGGGNSIIKVPAGSLTLTNSVTFIDANRSLILGGASTGSILGVIGSSTNNVWIEKEDAGTWIIGNNNTYPAATQVRGGILQVGTGGSLGNLSTNGIVVANTATLAFNRSDSYTTPNAISGLAAIRKLGAGTQTLTAVSPVAGTTEVAAGRLDVNGRLTNSVITVIPASTLGGSGGVGTVSVLGHLDPGVSVGILTATNVTLQTNSVLRIEAANFALAAGTGYDQLSVAGDLTVNATTANPSVLDLRSLNATAPGYAANFDAFSGVTLRVANVTGVLTGYAADQLVLVTTNFLNAYAGVWTTVVSGSSLDLVYAPSVAAGANALTWDALIGSAGVEEGSGIWSTGGTNWWDGAAEVPWNQAAATFGAGGSGSHTVSVDAAGVLASGLAFVPGASYTIVGPGAIALAPDGVATADVDGTVAANMSGTRLTKVGSGKLTLSGDASGFSAITITDGKLQVGAGGTSGSIVAAVTNNATLAFNRSDASTFPGTITGSGTVELNGSGAVLLTAANKLAGALVGSGSLTKQGAGELVFTGSTANTVSGELVVQNGTVRFAKPSGVAAWSGSILFTNDATVSPFVYLMASEQIPDATVLRFARQGTGYPHFLLYGNTETVAGVSCLTGNGVIENTQDDAAAFPVAHLIITNDVDQSFDGVFRNRNAGNAANYLQVTKQGVGAQSFASGTVTYTGRTHVAQGTLILSNTTAFASDITNDATVIFRLWSGSLNYSIRKLSGPGIVIKDGPQSLRMDGTNTFTGPLFINNGYVDTYGDGSIPSNCPVFIEGTQGIALYQGSTQWLGSINASTTSVNILGNTAGRTGVVVSLAASNSVYNGRVYQGAGPIRLVMAGSGEQTLGGTLDNASCNVEVQSGTLNLAKTSSAAIHAAAGSVVVKGGTLKLGGTGADQIFNNSLVTLHGGTLDLNGRSEGWDGLNGSAGTILNNATSTTSLLTLGLNNGNWTSGVSLADGAGALSVAKQGTGLWVVTNGNTFAGGLTVSNGTLRAANASGQASGAGTATVENLGVLDGTGTFGPLLVRNNGNVTPGIASLGTLNAGNTALGGAGRLTIDIMDFAGTAGATNGWDLLNVGGSLSGVASGVSPFVIALRSVTAGGTAGLAANFDGTLSYTVKVAAASGGITGISPNNVLVDASGLQNPQTGFWKVQVTGGDLELVYGQGATDVDPVSAWTNALAVTFCGYDRTETLTNFPALIVMSKYDARGSNMYSVLSDTASGSDLRFATTDAVPAFLNYEIEKWNPDGDSFIWVQIPALTAGLQIEIRGGNPNATSAPPAYAINGSVWSNNGYLGVWHFNGGSAVDSAGTNDGVRFGAGALAGTSLLGEAANFNGANQYIDIPDQIFDFSGGLTVEAWARPTVIANWARIIDFGNGPAMTNIVFARNATNANVTFEMYATQAGTETLTTGNTPIPVIGSWGHWVATHSAGLSNNATARLYMNGSERGVSTNSSTPPTVLRTSNYVGKSNWAADALFNGLIDELRISTIQRSSNWVYASYINMAAPQAFTCITGESKVRYWDANLAASGRQDGSGLWNLSSNAWQDAFGSNVAWASGAQAVLGSGVASPGTNVIVLADNVLVSGINVTTGTPYRIDGPAVHLFALPGAEYRVESSLELRTILTGSGFTKSGPGLLWLNPTNGIANNFTGAIAVTEGQLWIGGTVGDGTIRGGDITAASGTVVRLTAANPIVNNAMLTIAEGALLDLNAQSDAVGAIAGGGRITNNNVNFHVDDQARNAIFTGNIDLGTGGFYVRGLNGAGVQTLSGTNRFGTIGIERNGASLRMDGGSNYATFVAIGQQADGGALILNNTILNVAGNLYLGENATFRHGELYQTNSAVTVSGQLRVGHYGSETSLWFMSSGSVTMSTEAASNPFTAGVAEVAGGFYLGIDGAGRFHQYGGTLRASGIVLDNRGDTPSTDILQSEGGLISLGRWGIQGNASTLILLGGVELQAYQSWTSTLPFVLTGTNGHTVFSPSTNTIALNAGANGLGGLNVNAAADGGRLVLGGISTYSGLTTVSNGTLLVNGLSTVSAVTVESPGILGGTGTVGNATILGTLAPGASVGRLNAMDLTFEPGSRYEVEVNNFAAAAGTGWDIVSVTNTITAAAGPIVFDLWSLNGTTPGGAANFNGFNAYTLRVAQVAGTLALDMTNATLVTTNFINAYLGTWSLQTNGATIEIVYLPNSAPNPSAVAFWDATNDVIGAQEGSGTWDLVSTNWWDIGTSANIAWNNGTAFFNTSGSATGELAITVAAPGVLAESLYFAAGAKYSLSGAAIGLQGAQEITADSDTAIANTLSGSQLQKKGGAKLTLAGNASAFSTYGIDAGTLQVGTGGTAGVLSQIAPITNLGVLVHNSSAAAMLGGVISGSGTLEQAGPGVLTVAGANTYAGNTYITGGTFKMGNQRALGETSFGTFISPGGTLDLNGTTAGTNNASEIVTLSGSGVGGNGAIINSGGNANIMLRNVVMTGETAIGGSGGWIAIDGMGAAGSGYIQGGTNTLEKVGTNVVVIRSGIAVTLGVITVRSGQLSMEYAATWNNESPLNIHAGGLFYGYNWSQTMGRVVNLYGGTLQSLAGTLNITSTINVVSNGSVFFNSAALNHTGVIAGAGSLLLNASGSGQIMTWTGPDANSANGELVLYNGTMRFAKPANVNAWGGNLIVISNNPSASTWMELRSSEQFPDSAVLRFFKGGGNWPYFKMLGNSETVAGIDTPAAVAGAPVGVIELVEAEGSPGSDSTLTLNSAVDYTYVGYLRDRQSGSSTNRLHLRKLGAGRQSLVGARIGDIIWAGNVSVENGTLTFSNCTVGTSFQPVITNNAVVEFTGLAAGNAGLRRPLLAGGGSYLMSGQNQFFGASEATGTIEIVSGRLFNDNFGGIWTNSLADVVVHSGAAWDMRATMLQADTLMGTGTVLNSYYVTPGAFTNCLVLGVANGSGVFHGSIVGDVTVLNASNGLINVIKVGTGTQTFAGANAYGGFTAISNGTLLVDGSLGTGVVTVATAGTLGGSGIVSGNLTVAGTLAPGSSPGRLTLAAGLTLGGTATIAIEVNGTVQAVDHDHLVVNSAVALDGSLSVSISTGYTPAAGSVYTVMTANALSGSFLNVTNGGDLVVGVSTVKVHYGIGSLYNANEVVLTTTASVNPDSDGDGILDSWELSNFGSLTNANQMSQNDADGVSDFEEFIAGTDPNVDTSYLRITNEIRSVSGNVLFWPSTTNRLYDVEWSTNLGQSLWSPAASNLPSTPPANGFTNPAGPAVQHFRLKVRMGP